MSTTHLGQLQTSGALLISTQEGPQNLGWRGLRPLGDPGPKERDTSVICKVPKEEPAGQRGVPGSQADMGASLGLQLLHLDQVGQG